MMAHVRPTFSAERSELPMLYVLLAIASIELFVVHILVSLVSPAVAWVLSAITVAGIIQIATIVRRIKQRPILVTDTGIVIRSAKGFEVDLPWGSITSVKPIGYGPAPSGDNVLGAALLAHPNILVETTRAFTVSRLGRSRSASSLTFRVDEPEAFIGAVRSWLQTNVRT
jgi:hypothetical protein